MNDAPEPKNSTLAAGRRVRKALTPAVPRATLERAARRLADRLAQLELALDTDQALWGEYVATASALAEILAQVVHGRGGELLTTAEMATRLGVAPKTLLKHKARGQIRPALQRGKLIRWRGDEAS